MDDLRQLTKNLEHAFLALESDEHREDQATAAELSEALVAVRLRINEREQALEVAQAAMQSAMQVYNGVVSQTAAAIRSDWSALEGDQHA